MFKFYILTCFVVSCKERCHMKCIALPIYILNSKHLPTKVWLKRSHDSNHSAVKYDFRIMYVSLFTRQIMDSAELQTNSLPSIIELIQVHINSEHKTGRDVNDLNNTAINCKTTGPQQSFHKFPAKNRVQIKTHQ